MAKSEDPHFIIDYEYIESYLAKLDANQIDQSDGPFTWLAVDDDRHIAALFAYLPAIPNEVMSISPREFVATLGELNKLLSTTNRAVFEFESACNDSFYYTRSHEIPTQPLALGELSTESQIVVSKYVFSGRRFSECQTLYFDDSDWADFLDTI